MRQLNYPTLKLRELVNLRPGWWLLLILIFALPQTSPASEQLIFSYSFEPPSLRQQADQSWIAMPGLPSRGDPGEPILPVKSVNILLPPGHRVAEIEVTAPPAEILPGFFTLSHGQKQFPLSHPEDWQPTPRDEEIYSSSSSFPAQAHHLAGSWSLCGYSIAVINLYPVSYVPATGTISYYPRMEIHLRMTESPEALARTRHLLRSPEVMIQRITRLVVNPERLNSYRNLLPSRENLKGALVDTSEKYPYLIITDASLLSSFQPLAEFKTGRGQRARVITVQDITANYPGQDVPEQIRNFILDAYSGWETDFVLLGGDDEIIPHRGLYAEAFGYIDDDIPSDLYFGALDGSWNDDGDQLWGEPGEEDPFPEVSVGRAPVDSPEEVDHFVAKNIKYQQAPVMQQITEALMAGEQLFDNPVTWGGDYKDEIRFGAATNSCTTASFPPQFNVHTLYDRDLGFSWWGGILTNMINDGLHLINHVGHTSVDYALRMSADLVQNNLTNDGINSSFPIIYSQGCYAASFDNRTPGGQYLDDCVAE
ncbi:C25 family cysteine peptidase, partial [Candidatus Zixiibacteriota bacterium]